MENLSSNDQQRVLDFHLLLITCVIQFSLQNTDIILYFFYPAPLELFMRLDSTRMDELHNEKLKSWDNVLWYKDKMLSYGVYILLGSLAQIMSLLTRNDVCVGLVQELLHSW